MIYFFVILAIFIYYLFNFMKRGISEVNNYNNAINKGKMTYYDNEGTLRDIRTRQQLFHKTINNKRYLTFANGTIYTAIDDNNNDNVRNELNKINKEKAIRNGKRGYLYFPIKEESFLNNNDYCITSNHYYITFDTNKKYIYRNGILLFYNKENEFDRIITDNNLIKEYI